MGEMHTKDLTYNIPSSSRIHTLCENTHNIDERTHSSGHTHRDIYKHTAHIMRLESYISFLSTKVRKLQSIIGE